MDDLKNLSERAMDAFYYRAHSLVSKPEKHVQAKYGDAFTAPWRGLLAVGLNWEQVHYLTPTRDTSSKFVVLSCKEAYIAPFTGTLPEALAEQMKEKKPVLFRDLFDHECASYGGILPWLRTCVLPTYADHYERRHLKHPHHRFGVESFWDPEVLLKNPMRAKHRAIHEFVYELLGHVQHLKNAIPTSILSMAYTIPALKDIARQYTAKELGNFLRAMEGMNPKMVSLRMSGHNPLYTLDPVEWGWVETGTRPSSFPRRASSRRTGRR